MVLTGEEGRESGVVGLGLLGTIERVYFVGLPFLGGVCFEFRRYPSKCHGGRADGVM